ncbi:MAG: signal peptide peptidase SppA [Ignavibacteria bacterium]|jgi:protease-4|nr:signal peptide peptidase SppA [Ignavibacteria bacterium]MDH7527152.1 signal peptide peptidase SppA [Ignavibacteria bacterium]
MKRALTLLILSILFSNLFSQTNLSYQTNYNLFPASPGSLRFGLNGFDNPALLNYVKEPDLYFIWNTSNKSFFKMNDYGFFSAFKNFSFGFYSNNLIGLGRINNYKLAASTGNKSFGIGFAYNWRSTDIANLELKNLFTISTLSRPNKYFSLGLIGNFNSKFEDYEGVIDLAVRPLGNEKLTLFADFVHQNFSNTKSDKWSSGIIIEPFEGIQIIGRYFDTKSFSAGIQISFGRFSILQSNVFDKSGNAINQIQGIRLGSYDRNILNKVIKKEKTHQIDLNGQIKYQKFQLFDNSKTFYGLIDRLNKIKDDKSITTIEINTSGIAASRVFLWELREKLLELKNSGKKITIFIDNADFNLYHFASVADKIVMDPLGLITLEGILMGRNYYKGTLEKLGIGFDELRFFKYKSAAETYSREKMSDADREQRQLIVDNLYNTIKEDVESSRANLKLPLDSLVNNYVLFTSTSALNYGLVDSIGRWYSLKDGSELDKILRVVKDNTIESMVTNEDNYWGEKPKIAIVYTLGACAMDEGIKARSLIKDVEKIAKDKSIKAVIFRIDSPGGDALASDVIAEGMRKIKGKKPVIVSQGLVAGSGGYWLSMYADTIVSNKNTITGSIGVIGSWLYNKSFKESAGVSTDYVKRGNHADVGFGMLIPILNTVLPDRKLTNDERSKIEMMIREMYAEFVNKVANGRNKSPDEIEQIAQGRVWSGIDAKKIGLVDVLGGLSDAIEIAREKANLKKDEFQVVEFPKPQLFDLSFVLPLSLQSIQKNTPLIDFINFNLKNNGKPMMLMPFEYIPEDYFLKGF